jgi:hypothetical protein
VRRERRKIYFRFKCSILDFDPICLYVNALDMQQIIKCVGDNHGSVTQPEGDYHDHDPFRPGHQEGASTRGPKPSSLGGIYVARDPTRVVDGETFFVRKGGEFYG